MSVRVCFSSGSVTVTVWVTVAPVRGARGVSFIASLAFPQTRLGKVAESKSDFAQLELNLMQVGRDYGWMAAAQMAGLTPI